MNESYVLKKKKEKKEIVMITHKCFHSNKLFCYISIKPSS